MLASIWIANDRLRWGTDVWGILLGTLILGLPIAAAATVVFGLPAYYLLRAMGQLRFLPITVAGTMSGFITALVLFSWTQEWKMLPLPVGVLIGFVSAVVWWLKAGRPGLMRKAETQ
jgi:hypothetical protein